MAAMLGQASSRQAMGAGILLVLLISAQATPRFMGQRSEALIRSGERRLNGYTAGRDGGIPAGGYEAVAKDIARLMTDSQDFWPADFGNYGPFFIRLAWHCSGSFRVTDGRGGCDGGRIRHDPEMSWADNANLDMALKLLEPIKEKYGSSLSWGDLIILAGTTAVKEMGGPTLGFCGGRYDDADGTDSLQLGPSPEQEALGEAVLGPTTIGLIYVDPAGHNEDGDVDPHFSAGEIRETFARMRMNDTETAALIGGGHAFGKTHGACRHPPCGSGDLKGRGPNTFTSGFEGAWSTIPTTWSNQFFTNLLDYNWNLAESPAGNPQWVPSTFDGSPAPPVVMLTSDIAMMSDDSYVQHVQDWAQDISGLEEQFAAAWYKLTTGDMGPASRCLGDDVPPPQAFQNPLPEAQPVDNMKAAYVEENALMSINQLIKADISNAAKFAHLAWQCASTFRITDYQGGCNGARIRFAPQAEWPENKGAAEVISILEPVKEEFPEISYADLIVLAGNAGVEAAGGNHMTFCGGRVDAEDGGNTDYLAPRYYSPLSVQLRDDMLVKGLTPVEYVAIVGGMVYSNAIPSNFTARAGLSNNFFVRLAAGNGIATETERALLDDEEFKAIVAMFAEDEAAFKAAFADAWTKMMNADRFDGPRGNLCNKPKDGGYRWFRWPTPGRGD